MGLDKVESSQVMTDLLRRCGGYAVIDGGLATELERHGADLNDPLWSAKCLMTSPQLIRRVLPLSASVFIVCFVCVCVFGVFLPIFFVILLVL